MEPFLFQFVNSAIPDNLITQLLEQAHDKYTGAQSIFIGRIRADEIEDATTTAIEYSAYEDLAQREAQKIIEELRNKYSLHYLIIYHSLGRVNVNQIAMVILTASSHRNDAIASCNEAISMIKKQLPIWGLEVLHNGQLLWKVNTHDTSHKLSNSRK